MEHRIVGYRRLIEEVAADLPDTATPELQRLFTMVQILVMDLDDRVGRVEAAAERLGAGDVLRESSERLAAIRDALRLPE